MHGTVHAGLWTALAYFAAGAAVIAAMLVASHFVGERRERAQEQPYEAGMLPTATAEAPASVRFYLMAMLFLVFDVEAAFILAWAVAAKELGWAGWLDAVVFIGVLVAAWFYLWRIGALEWGTTALFRRRRRAARIHAAEPEPEVEHEVVAAPGR